MTETIPFEELELGEVVGSGQSGSLYRATWKGRTVAVKMVKVRGPAYLAITWCWLCTSCVGTVQVNVLSLGNCLALAIASRNRTPRTKMWSGSWRTLSASGTS